MYNDVPPAIRNTIEEDIKDGVCRALSGEKYAMQLANDFNCDISSVLVYIDQVKKDIKEEL